MLGLGIRLRDSYACVVFWAPSKAKHRQRPKQSRSEQEAMQAAEAAMESAAARLDVSSVAVDLGCRGVPPVP